jgi:hypothetical protein
MRRATCTLLFLFAAPAAEARPARSYTFDGFKLGDDYAKKAMARAPYNEPCDNDPIDNRIRRFMVYGAEPCRGRSFPDKTTVMFYLAFSDADKYGQPIQAFAYLHGSYFNKRSSFPVKPGQSLAQAQRSLGKAKTSFDISRKKYVLTVHRFAGDVHVLAPKDGQKIVGFVFGQMPDDATNEQWRGLMQMYQRYTPKE